MKIQVKWDNLEQTTLRLVFSGTWNWGDVDQAWDTAVAMAKGTTGQIDILVDMQASKGVPRDIMLVGREMMLHHLPSRCGLIVFVGGNSLIRAAISLLRNICQSQAPRLLMADNLKQGRQLLYKTVSLPAKQAILESVKPLIA